MSVTKLTILLSAFLVSSCSTVTKASDGKNSVFSSLGACGALAQWIEPVKSRYGTSPRSWDETTTREKYKFLFTDAHFEPIFGTKVDDLNRRQIAKIYKSLKSARSGCKGQPYLQSIYPDIFLSRVFHAGLPNTAFSYSFVSRYAAEQREITARGNLTPDKSISRNKIRHVQQKLHELGLKPGPQDGALGPSTENAIIAFKESEGINPTDSRITSILIDQLDKASQALVKQSKAVINLEPKTEGVEENRIDTIDKLDTTVAAVSSSDANKASSSEASIELPSANPEWPEEQLEYYVGNRERFKENIRKCETGVSQDCYYAGKKLSQTGDRYNSSRKSTYQYEPDKENAIKYYKLALVYLDRDCELGDVSGGCQAATNIRYVMGELDPYAEPDGYPRYIADAKNGDISALKYMNETYIRAHDRMYELGLQGESGLQSSEYHRLRQERATMAKIGTVSKKNALALMHILLIRAENTHDIDYALGVTGLGRNAGFKDGETEIDHFGRLASAKAGYYLAETKRGFGHTMKHADALLLSPYEDVKKEAAALHDKARRAAAGAPPPRDQFRNASSGEFARALTSFLIFTWSLPPPGENANADTKDYSWKQPDMNLGEILEWVK